MLATAQLVRLLTIVVPVLLVTSSSATTLFVNLSRPDDSGDGTTWASAKKTIQAAINIGTSGDEVWVASGTYVEIITMVSGIAVYGGFAGTEMNLLDRDPATNLTIIDAATLPSGSHVVWFVSLTNTRLDGLTIRGGHVAGAVGTTRLGGGLFFNGSDSTNTVENCTIRDNSATSGGGIYCLSSSPEFRNCTIIANKATGTSGISGGGVFCETNSLPLFEDCVISSNSIVASSQHQGGGFFLVTGSNATIRRCIITGNTVTGGDGGGICCGRASFGPASATIENCVISGNTATNGGGIASRDTSTPIIRNCSIVENDAATSGGGLYTLNTSAPTVRNCIFRANTNHGVTEGASTTDVALSNCLFSNNTVGDLRDENTTTVTGAAGINAVSGNSGNVQGDPQFVMDSVLAITGSWSAAPTYSATTNRTTLTAPGGTFISNALAGESINADVTQLREAYVYSNTDSQIVAYGDLTGFAANGDAYKIVNLHLYGASPAIDSASATGAPATDLDGNARPVDYPVLGENGTGTEFDIGAYEADAPPAVSSITRTDANPSNSAAVNFTVTFTKSVTGVDLGDFSLATTGVSGASLASVSADTGATRTVSVNTGIGNGTLRLDLTDDDTVQDASFAPLGGVGAGNGEFTTGETYDIDKTAPAITLSTSAGNPVGGAFTVDVATGESTTNFDAGDISPTNGTVSAFTGSGDSYSFNFTPTATPCSVNITAGKYTDAAGNLNLASNTISRNFDSTLPSVLSIVPGTTGPTNAGAISFTVTFDESVQNVTDASDLVITHDGTAHTGTSVTGGPTSYTVSVTGVSGDGSFTLAMNTASDIKDLANNPLASSVISTAVYIDNTGPGSTLSSTAPDPTNGAITVDVSLSEASNDFDSTDIAPVNATVSNLIGSGDSYAFTLTPTSDGAFSASVTAGSYADLAGNPGTASNLITRTFDGTDPVFSNLVSVPAIAHTGELASITFDGSEPLLGDPDVTVNGNPATRLAKTGSAFTYSYAILPTDPLGPANLQIQGVDTAGNVALSTNNSALEIVAAPPAVPLLAWPIGVLLLTAGALVSRRSNR